MLLIIIKNYPAPKTRKRDAPINQTGQNHDTKQATEQQKETDIKIQKYQANPSVGTSL